MAYLAYILGSMPEQEDRIRTIAGYLLKNNARSIQKAAPEVVTFTKAAVLQAFNDPATMIRNAAGQDIVAFLGILEPKNWPECLSQLVQTLDSSNLDQQEVSLPISFGSRDREVVWMRVALVVLGRAAYNGREVLKSWLAVEAAMDRATQDGDYVRLSS